MDVQIESSRMPSKYIQIIEIAEISENEVI